MVVTVHRLPAPAGYVGRDKSDIGEQLAFVPHDLGLHPARVIPTPRLLREALMEHLALDAGRRFELWWARRLGGGQIGTDPFDSPARLETDPDNRNIQDDDVVEGREAAGDGGELDSTDGDAGPAPEIEFASVSSKFSQLFEWKQFTCPRFRGTGRPP